jgi:hypothetical protein
VVAYEVILDGEARPDVARSISDSISSALIKGGRYRVFARQEQPVREVRPTRRKRDVVAGAGAPNELPLPMQAPRGSDFLFTFNVIGEGEAFRLMMKKVSAVTSEVLGVEEMCANGGLETLFAMVPTTLRGLERAAGPVAHAFPRSQSPAQMREVIRPAIALSRSEDENLSPGLREYYAMQLRVPPEYGTMDLKDVPRALIYQPMGAVQFINDAWKFCVINPLPGHKFAVNQNLDVLYDEDGRPYGSLRVDALDSGKVVAGYGRTPVHHPLFRGDVVYGWAPPLR